MRAAPLRDGELVVADHPLELPGVPVSWTAVQPLSASMLLTLDAEAGAAEEVLTVSATSVTQEAPETPQAFTCKVCPPADTETVVAMEGAWKTVVYVLLSNE